VPLGLDEGIFYFGLAGTNSVDDEEVIPFFTAEREQFLEYDVTKLVHNLSSPKRKIVGLLSSLPVEGAGPQMQVAMPGMGGPPWMVVDQVRQLFEVRSLHPKLEEIPEDVDVLMLVHPQSLSREALYAIDQYVLRGGRVVAFVDPFSEAQQEAMAGGFMQPAMSKRSEVDELLAAWLARAGDEWNAAGGRDLIWRSRAAATPALLRRILADVDLDASDAARYLRAFDFQAESAAKEDALRRVSLDAAGDAGPAAAFIASEAAVRLERIDLENDPEVASALSTLLSTDVAAGLVEALGRSREPGAVAHLEAAALDDALDWRTRDQAVRGLARTRAGAERLVELGEQRKLPEELHEVAGAALSSVMQVPVRERAAVVYPLPPTKSPEPLPQMTDLLVLLGDADRGREVFASATCGECHIVAGHGTEYGPDLSTIGAKLAKKGLYESILDPSASVSPTYAPHLFELANGESVVGMLVSETDSRLIVRTEGGVVTEYERADVESVVPQSVSIMPSDLSSQMRVEELIDLVEYLTTLR